MASATPITSDPHVMQCMEVWGGNRAVDAGVVMPGLDVWVYALPYDEDERAGELDRAGGDVHLVSSCGTGRIARMMVADVSGHGAKVAALAVTLRRLMRRFMNYLDQTAFVEALNRAFGELEQSGRFATSVAMTFFAPTARLDVCNAGHPRPLRFSAATRRWEILEAGASQETSAGDLTNLPLGILEPTRYEQFGIELGRNDLILVYTDALNEARSATGEMLGEAGLLSILGSLDASSPAALIPALLDRVAAWRDGAPPDDDITVLLLRHNGSARQAPLFRRLSASLRFLGTLLRNCIPFGDRPPIPWPEARAENLIGAFIPRIARRWRAKRA
jgi:sigma-B regulation protein RsbU (phosphoserine phosphatase)